MPKQNFYKKLKDEGKLNLVETSEHIKDSYLEKSSGSLKAAQILIKTDLLEQSVSMSYYAMYHCLQALMFKCGIKCENHNGNILILKTIFNERELFELISKAKKERIDKQYYADFELSKKDAEELVKKAIKFTTRMRLLIERINKNNIEEFRSSISHLIGN